MGITGESSLSIISQRQPCSPLRPSSQPAPSRLRPLMYEPEAAYSGMSSTSTTLVTSVFRVMSSRGRFVARAVICMIAVKKDIGLKSPETHSTDGVMNSSLHLSSCSQRKIKSSIQASKFFLEKQAFFAHQAGIWFLLSASARVSIDSVMLRVPLRPASSSMRVILISERRPFMRSHSCRQTTTKGGLSVALANKSSMTNFSGVFSRIN